MAARYRVGAVSADAVELNDLADREPCAGSPCASSWRAGEPYTDIFATRVSRPALL